MEQLTSGKRLPSLRLQHLIPNLKNPRAIQSQPKLHNQAQQGVYTVNESLKDEYVLKNLDLGLGTLPLFMDLKTNDPTPLFANLRLNKRLRRKNEPKEDQGELFQKKANNTQQEKNPFEILKTVDDEKTRGMAAKQIVSQIFKRIYGDDVDKFEEKNSKQVLQRIYIQGVDHDDPKIHFIKKNIKKNMEERFDIFIKQMEKSKVNKGLKLKVDSTPQSRILIRQSTSNKLNFDEVDQSDEQSQENGASLEKSRQNEQVIQLPKIVETSQIYVLQKAKLSFFGNNFIRMSVDNPQHQIDIKDKKQKRLNSLQKLIQRFPDVYAVWNNYWKDSGIKPTSFDTEEYIEIQKNFHPNIKAFFQSQEVILDKNLHNLQLLSFDQVDHLLIKAEKQEIVILDLQKQIIIRNIDITDEVMPWLLFQTEHWGNLTRIEFYNTKLSDGAFKMLLNNISLECNRIQQLVLSFNHLTPLSTSIVTKTLKDQTQLSILKMVGMGMGSKEFTQICLAICEGKLTTINFSQNQIDKRGLKPIETLLRYVKSLESVDFSENNFTDNSEEEKTKLFRQLRKIVIYNEGLKNKNIKI